jgi:hypothetical protein
VALALDGTPVHVSNSTGTLTTATFTTTGGSGVIIVGIGSNAASITSVTATGLTFTNLHTIVGSGGSNVVGCYTAPYTSNFSGTIQVVVASASFGVVDVFAVTGCPTTSFFDPNVSLPAVSTGSTASGTTTNANDFVFFVGTNSATGGTAGTGWNTVGGTNFQVCGWKIVSAAGAQAVSFATGTCRGSILDAVVQAVITDPGTVGMTGITRLGSTDWRWT